MEKLTIVAKNKSIMALVKKQLKFGSSKDLGNFFDCPMTGKMYAEMPIGTDVYDGIL